MPTMPVFAVLSILFGVALLGIFVGLITLAASLVRVGPDQYGLINWKFLLSPSVPEGHFIARTGRQQGWWAKVFTPGLHFIPFAHWFGDVKQQDLVTVPEGKFGIVEALDGEPLPQGQLVSGEPITIEDILDGEAFLENGLRRGHRGHQVPMLVSGKYPLNEKLFKLSFQNPSTIGPGLTGVLISSVGEEPTPEDILEEFRNTQGKQVYILKPDVNNRRGIRIKPLYPGTHPINLKATALELVDVTPDRIKLDGTSESTLGIQKMVFDRVSAPTKDPFMVPLKAEVVIKINPEDAPRIIAIGGTLADFVRDIVFPYVDDISKTVLSQIKVDDLIKDRDKIRRRIENALRVALEGKKKAEDKMKEAGLPSAEQDKAIKLGKQKDPGQHYPVEVVSFRIIDIDYDAADPALQKHLDLYQRQANAVKEAFVLPVEKTTEEERTKLAHQQAMTENQEELVQAEYEKLAAPAKAAAARILGDAAADNLKKISDQGPAAKVVAQLLSSPLLGIFLQNMGEGIRSKAEKKISPPPPAAT